MNSCRFEVGAMARELREKIEIVEKKYGEGRGIITVARAPLGTPRNTWAKKPVLH